ncbi:hypothetical protein NMG60_11013920 [Bertholletia excelsa]
MLPTGKARSEELRRLFSRPGPHVFKDATIPLSFVGPHVVEFLFLSPSSKTLELDFLLSKAISGCDKSQLSFLLCSAVKIGNSRFVSALVDAGVDVNCRDTEGQSVMSLAVQSGSSDSIQILVEAGCVIDRAKDRSLHFAAEMDRIDLVEVLRLAFRNIDLNSVDSLHGGTALHVAATHGHARMIQKLLSIGCDPDALDRHGRTPLHCAVAEGHKDAVELLLNSSMFAKHAVTAAGKAAFDLALENGHSHLYEMLELEDSLHRAARNDDVEEMKRCFEKGARVNGRDQNGWTALHRAAFKGRVRCVELLIQQGARVDSVDCAGRTPADLAAEAGHLDVAARLVAGGSKANVEGLKGVEFGLVPFNLDRFKNHPSLVAPLVQEKERA